jgi:hypothetical protein
MAWIDVANWALIIGVGVFAITALICLAWKGNKMGLKILGVGFVVLLVGGGTYGILTLSGVTNQTQSIAPPPSGGAVVTTVSGGSVGSAGVTWNSQTDVLTVDLVYNYSTGANYFCVEAANATCGPTAGHTSSWPNYLLVPMTLSRTDAVNQTFGYTTTVTQIPTYNTVSGTTTTYSVIGYKPASGSSTGQWQTFFSAGSFANQNPSVAAPATTSNILSSLVGIAPFKSVTQVLHVSLTGGNSTSAPLSGSTSALFTGTTISQFVAMPETITIQASNPTTITIAYIVIGQHA